MKKTILATVCALLLSGCSTMMEDIDAYFSGDDQSRETVYTYQDPSLDMTYGEMAREMSTGSVQVYGLDGSAPSPRAYPERSTNPSGYTGGYGAGVASSVDPNVTVYPLFAGKVSDESAAQTPPSLRPPSAQTNPLDSPFDGPIQTPEPRVVPLSPPPSYTSGRSAADQGSYRSAGSTSRVYFSHGSSRLNSTGKQVVDFVGRSNPGKVVIEGHASERAETMDPVERKIINLKMSMDRAFRVSSELIRDGVPLENIETKAYGDARPAGPVSGIGDEAANRRVEIKTPLSAPQDTSFVPEPVGPAPIPPLARY